jgi:hypothetical protein
MLPATSSGMLVYADLGAQASNSANTLWIPLAEKAYAEWNQTGNEGRDGRNAYASIAGGVSATVDAQVLGYNAKVYMTDSSENPVPLNAETVAINALDAREAVTIGTDQWSGTQDGLYADHAYAIIGYTKSTNTFTLYNPWGFDQPGQLTWSQLQADCLQFAVANTAGSVPILNASVQVASVKAALGESSVAGGLPLLKPSAATPATFDPTATASASGQPPAASVAARELFEALGSDWAEPSAGLPIVAQVDDGPSAPLVDAAMAIDGLLPQFECAAFCPQLT